MNNISNKVICDCCGEHVFKRSLELENIQKYDTSSKPNFIKKLAELENVSEEIAASWAEHGLYEQCTEKTRKCPNCGYQLKTWRAKLCVKCNATFKSWMPNE
jgi:predicted RNA-binding Zn-ribbon protein involved in translation (DUF1610 family)